jgi:hypothetical protein
MTAKAIIPGMLAINASGSPRKAVRYRGATFPYMHLQTAIKLNIGD